MLAQATGFYAERPAGGLLREHFACVWVHRLCKPGASLIVVPPDGHIDLQWIDGQFRVAGPDREPQIEIPAAGATVIGFRFRPAAARLWLGVPASEIVNLRLPLEDLWGAKARRLAGEVGEERDLGALVQALETALARREPALSARDTLMRKAFDLVSASAAPGRPLAPWLASELALSQRTLRRRFDEAFGYGPKTLARILRFQRFLSLVRGSRGTSAASRAAEAGYADQAHLARESRRLAIGTPGEIADMFKV